MDANQYTLHPVVEITHVKYPALQTTVKEIELLFEHHVMHNSQPVNSLTSQLVSY